jgi:hypothetical protein
MVVSELFVVGLVCQPLEISEPQQFAQGQAQPLG